MPVALTVCGQREAWVEKMRPSAAFPLPPPPRPTTSRPRGMTLSWTPRRPPCSAARRAKAPRPAAAVPRAAAAAPRAAAPKKPAAAKGGPVLKGRAVGDAPVPIGELAEDSGIVVIEGTVTGVNDPKELKGGETVLASFAVYDDTSTIYCKAFYNYRMRRAARGETPEPPTKEERARSWSRSARSKTACACACGATAGWTRFWENCP